MMVSTIQRVNDQVTAHTEHMAALRDYLPQSVGALKCDHKEIMAKLDRLITAVDELNARLDFLESVK